RFGPGSAAEQPTAVTITLSGHQNLGDSPRVGGQGNQGRVSLLGACAGGGCPAAAGAAGHARGGCRGTVGGLPVVLPGSWRGAGGILVCGRMGSRAPLPARATPQIRCGTRKLSTLVTPVFPVAGSRSYHYAQ